MIGKFPKVGPRVYGGFDPDAQAFITAAAITDPTQQSAINQLVVDLKAQSLWTKLKAVYPFVGGTALSHKYNLKDPRDLDAAFKLMFSGGWTHTANGAKPNGTNGYADTFLIPTTETAMGVYTTEQVDTDIRVIICQGLNGGHYISPSINTINLRGTSSGSISNLSNTKGMLIAFDTDTSTTYYYNLNGTGNSNTRTYSAFNSNSYIIGGFSSSAYFTQNNLAFAFIGSLSNQTDATTLRNIVQAFQTALSRNV